MKFEMENAGAKNRRVKMSKKTETTLLVNVGVEGNPGEVYLSRWQALAMADALKAMSRDLEE